MPAKDKTTLLVIHCSATKVGQKVDKASIAYAHKKRGFSEIGYHFLIMPNGEIVEGRETWKVGAHVQGHNHNSLGICLIGGLDHSGKPAPLYTKAQLESLKALCEDLKRRYPIKRICGHRDLSPDLNGNGIVEPREWVKECPCFEVEHWLKTGEIKNRGLIYENIS